MKIPLFPLNSIICPGGRIPLQVFEPRYLDMISDSLKRETEFVAVLLRNDIDASSGEVMLGDRKQKEVAENFYRVGTLVKVVDFELGASGFLNVTIEGTSRVNLSLAIKRFDGSWFANTVKTDEDDFVALPECYEELRVVLQALVQHPYVHGLHMDINFQDGQQVGLRLTELLPIDNKQKQMLFELNDPIQRLSQLSDQLAAMML